MPALLLGLPSLQACRQQLAVATQLGSIAAGIGGKPEGQLIDAHAVQPQPAAIEQQHWQSAMPALFLLLLGQTTLQLLPLVRSQAHQGIHHQALSLRTGRRTPLQAMGPEQWRKVSPVAPGWCGSHQLS